MSSTRPATPGSYAARAVDALLRLREIEEQKSRETLLFKQKEVWELERELDRLRERRDSVLARGGAGILAERLLLDALLQAILRRNRELESLRKDARQLIDRFRTANQKRKAVGELREKQKVERETNLERRLEEAAGDLAATRLLAENRRREVDACHDD
jgi:flagellar biosynthesis chaperone FliJ